MTGVDYVVIPGGVGGTGFTTADVWLSLDESRLLIDHTIGGSSASDYATSRAFVAEADGGNAVQILSQYANARARGFTTEGLVIVTIGMDNACPAGETFESGVYLYDTASGELQSVAAAPSRSTSAWFWATW